MTPKWLLVKSSTPKSGSTVDPGSTITYKLTVTNVSEAVVSNAIVRDDLSDVLAHGTLVAVPPQAKLDGTTLIWEVPPLDPNKKDTLTYQVKLDADAFDVSVTNVATPGTGGDCDTTCSTHHTTPPRPVAPPTEPPHQTPPPPAEPPTQALPDTGGAPIGLALAGFAALMGGGILLGATRRRRRDR